MPNVQAIPPGFQTLTPSLVVKGAAQAIDFYKKAFGAKENFRMPSPDGKTIMHAELQIGSSPVMLSDEWLDMGAKSPQALGGTPVTIHIYVNNVDEFFNNAVKSGCTVTMPLADMFWGDRYGRVSDPFGHNWSIAQHIEDLTPEQMDKKMKEAMSPHSGNCCSK